MPMQVCMGASMMCTMGMAPSSLVVLPTNKVLTGQVPDANITDHVPMVNIMAFGLCTSFGESGRSRGHRSCLGGLNPYALYPEYACAVGCRSANGDPR